MTATTNADTRTRWIDSGNPRLLPAEAPIRALQTSVCQDLQTKCTYLHSSSYGFNVVTMAGFVSPRLAAPCSRSTPQAAPYGP
ncbi:hypothetical protein [Paraliomyxa miuraensis]|uniref:hypothetical protein n=1 Tax=Paraliomyxa miuraensis TaxID=376150 RepID=UPI002256607D|nr:hypothetical protein [Paraliomyxa miuraensis]MCX4243992.1 hypothetical protein [Paraliomyxa miuraensis]